MRNTTNGDTPRHTIRVADDRWARWVDATFDADYDVADVTELIHNAVEAYLNPSARQERDRATIVMLLRTLVDVRKLCDKALEALGG